MTLTLGSAPLGRSAAGKFNFDSASHIPFVYWEPFPKRMRVEFNGKVVADSRAVHAAHESGKMMELYFPSADVEKKWLEASGHRTDSPALGTASYWSLNVDGKRAKNVAWCFEQPNEAAAFVHGFFAFDLDKVDACIKKTSAAMLTRATPITASTCIAAASTSSSDSAALSWLNRTGPFFCLKPGRRFGITCLVKTCGVTCWWRAVPCRSARTRVMANTGILLSSARTAQTAWATSPGPCPTPSARQMSSPGTSASTLDVSKSRSTAGDSLHSDSLSWRGDAAMPFGGDGRASARLIDADERLIVNLSGGQARRPPPG